MDANAPALLLIPGSIENGHIFYSKSGKGFAPWMAERGFDVFVADLRGRGLEFARGGEVGQERQVHQDRLAARAFVDELARLLETSLGMTR